MIISMYFTLQSCDKIQQPIEKKDLIEVPDSILYDTVFSEKSNSKKIMLLEEFTGFKCPNCPDGTKKLNQLLNTYSDQLIAVSIHAGIFAVPTSNSADNSFTNDYRTNDGETYMETFLVEGFPSGMVNRMFSGNKFVVGKDEWETRINVLKDETPKYSVQFLNLYNDSLNILKTEITLNKLTSLTEPVKVSAFIIENKIIDWQIDNANILSDYEHNYVLRRTLNGTWGDDVIWNDNTFMVSYQINPETTWNLQNTQVVVFVYNSDTKEIYQSNIARITS